jgi:hypothetical protein
MMIVFIDDSQGWALDDICIGEKNWLQAEGWFTLYTS